MQGVIHMREPDAAFPVANCYAGALSELHVGLRQTGLWATVGNSCFIAAGFVQQAFSSLGRRARIVPCYALAARDNTGLLVGYKSQKPGQGEGHVACLVDDKILVDFCLNGLHRFGWTDFPSVAACEIGSRSNFPAELALDDQRKIIWQNDWVHPSTAASIAGHRRIHDTLFKHYRAVLSRCAAGEPWRPPVVEQSRARVVSMQVAIQCSPSGGARRCALAATHVTH